MRKERLSFWNIWVQLVCIDCFGHDFKSSPKIAHDLQNWHCNLLFSNAQSRTYSGRFRALFWYWNTILYNMNFNLKICWCKAKMPISIGSKLHRIIYWIEFICRPLQSCNFPLTHELALQWNSFFSQYSKWSNVFISMTHQVWIEKRVSSIHDINTCHNEKLKFHRSFDYFSLVWFFSFWNTKERI